MIEERDDAQRTEQLRIMQLCVGAMLLGTGAFAGVAAWLRSAGIFQNQGAIPILTIVGAVYFACLAVIRPMALSAAARAARKRIAATDQNTPEAWMSLFHARIFFGAALWEGGAFLFLVAYLIEGHPGALFGAIAMIAMIALFEFPTRERLDRIIAAEQERMGASEES
jgi:FtsH-binding integral membrane protein